LNDQNKNQFRQDTLPETILEAILDHVEHKLDMIQEKQIRNEEIVEIEKKSPLQ
jgi:hypothetical protein